MSVLINDNFSGYTPGPSQFPTGFQGSGIVFNTSIVVPGSPTPAPGFYEKTGNLYILFGEIVYPTTANLASTVGTQTTAWWTTLTPNATNCSGGTLSVAITDPIAPHNRTNLINVVCQVDGSVSLVIPGVSTILNTLTQVIFPYTFQIFQLDVLVGTAIIGGTTYITVTPGLAVNGIVYFSGIPYTTNIISSASPIGADLNSWYFNGPANGVYWSEIVILDTLASLPSYQNPVTPLHAFESQIILETMELPNNQNARLTQSIVEVAKLPNNSNARLTQAVIEIIKKYIPGLNEWQIYEA